jgi:hypothetical protein
MIENIIKRNRRVYLKRVELFCLKGKLEIKNYLVEN